MLGFFRKYQRYFFVVITIVIVISFSFFGTYSTLGSDQWREQVAFTAVDGSDVTRYELDEMAVFLSSDNEDKILFGGAWGPNFLNDGVIRKDFLETGIGEELIVAYIDGIQEDLQRRHEKEKKFQLYSHPQAPFLSVANVWGYFAPQMKTFFDTIQKADDPAHPKAIDARIQLFLAEKKVPQSTVKQLMKYQERQYNWISPDPNLARTDLSLFGYHTVEDWFGPRFVRLVSQFIINTAKIAEEKGYSVSKAEAMAELIRNTDISYQQNQNKANIGVATPTEYLKEQLRLLHMDQGRAVKVWQQVMLFRRFFHDVGNAALVDTFTYKKFNDYTKEALELDMYRLPASLRLANYRSLQQLEVYLSAVSNRPKEGAALLKLPTSFTALAEVAKQNPELVQRKFRLEVSQADKKNLQARIGIKETWAWELDEANWKNLQNKFPELGTKTGKTREERLAALDSLDEATRSRVDSFARSSMVDAHPEWLTKALEEDKAKTIVVGLRVQGGNPPFAGLADKADKQKEFMAILDKAATDQTAQGQLKQYSADGQTYYKIKVLERAPQQEILTFEEAARDGTLDKLSTKILEKHYADIRQNSPLLYQNSNGSWKEFSQVKDLVAESYFANVLKAIQDDRKAQLKDKAPTKTTHDEDASARLFAYLRDIQAQLKKDPAAAAKLIKQSKETASEEKLAEAKPLQDQWLIEKATVRLDRSDENPLVDDREAFSLTEKGWSSVKTSPNGDIAFYQVVRHVGAEEKEIAIADQTNEAHAMLSADAQRVLTHKVLKDIQDKHAISLDYLKVSQEQ